MNWLEKMGIELPIFQWTEPRATAHLDWQRESWPTCKKFIALFCKFGIAIGLPVLVATKIWLPEGFARAAIGLSVVLIFCCLLPTFAFLQVWIISNAGIVCAITTKGLVKSGVSYEWQNIVAHQFSDYPDLAKVRVLRVQVRGENGEYRREFRFDSAKVSETQIRELIEKFRK